MKEQNNLYEIEDLCKSISAWLVTNHNPYMTVVIDSTQARLVVTEQGLPLEKGN